MCRCLLSFTLRNGFLILFFLISKGYSADLFHPQRFKQVDNFLYRSGRPHHEQMKKLSEEGFRAILNLESFLTTLSDARAKEAAEASRLRMDFLNVPMRARNVFLMRQGITDKDVFAALLYLRQKTLAEEKTLVHCREGKDRTGLIIALYRVIFQNWNKETAFKEAEDMGHVSKEYPLIREVFDRWTAVSTNPEVKEYLIKLRSISQKFQ